MKTLVLVVVILLLGACGDPNYKPVSSDACTQNSNLEYDANGVKCK